MENFLNSIYYEDCNLTGTNHDFHTTLANVSKAIETKGEVGWVFDSETGKIKIIEATTIGNGFSPNSKPGKVYDLGNAAMALSVWGLSAMTGFTNSCYLYRIERGPFAGNFLVDGIIVNRSLKTMGYRILGFDENGNPAWADLPVGIMGLVFEPDFTDQIMGYPGLSPIINYVGTADDWRYYIGQAMKLSASMAVTRKSKDGRPAGGNVGYTTFNPNTGDITSALPGDPPPATVSGDRVLAFEIRQSGLVELATDNDESVEAVPFERPSMGESEFLKELETGFFADHWPRSFLYTEGQGRAATRVDIIHARQKVWQRHRTLARFGVAWLRKKIAHGMVNGEIPKNENLFDPYNIGLSTPAEPSVDEGNDAKIDLLNLSRGVTSKRVVCAKLGLNEERIDAENDLSIRGRMDRAIKISQEKVDADGKPVWTPKEVMLMLDNMDSNITFNDDPGAIEPEPVKPKSEPEIIPAKGKGKTKPDSKDEQ